MRTLMAERWGSRRALRAALAALVTLLATLVAACNRGGDRDNVLVAQDQPVVTLMDFQRPFPLDPPPAGWYHRTFWTRAPMQMSFADKDGVAALRMATRGSASMLFRHVDVDLATYPILAWRWFIEVPIRSPADERTRAGDDHPARFFLVLRTPGGEEHKMEIIWGNRLHRGDYKFIDGFPHYVADGGLENIARWRNEEIDLLAIYRHLWPESAPPHLIDLALFCDSDETDTSSVSYVADVEVRRTANLRRAQDRSLGIDDRAGLQ